MTILKILVAPDARLKKVAKPVGSVTPEIRQTLDDMLETMYAARGIGLAATQVGIAQRLVVVDLANPKEEPSAPKKFINPEVVWASKDLAAMEEGCLSVPNYFDDVERPAECTIKFLDENGAVQEETYDGLMAACIQHEIDHLDGQLFVDHLSRLRRERALKKLEKAKKTNRLDVAYAVEE